MVKYVVYGRIIRSNYILYAVDKVAFSGFLVRQKMRTHVTNKISLYKLTNALFFLIFFKLVMKSKILC